MKLQRWWVAAALSGVAVLAQAQEANPLARFVGVWEGDKGMDVAPAQKKTGTAGAVATSPFFERIEIAPGPAATNASEQDLVALTVRQKVYRKSDNQQFHDQLGYLIWDKKNASVIYSFCVPRGVCVTADGKSMQPDEVNVSTKSAFAETAFMQKNAKTQNFSMGMKINADGTFSYSQVTALKIYGKPFSHVDSNVLKKVADQPS